MTELQEKILFACSKPQTNRALEKTLRLSKYVVSKEVKNLRRMGLVVSWGATAARTHSTVGSEFEKFRGTVLQLNKQVTRLEKMVSQLSGK